MRRKIKKLNYEKIDIDGYKVNFSRSSTRSISITINQKNEIFLVAPRFVLNMDIIDFFRDKKGWIDKCIKKNKEKLADKNIIYIKEDFKLKLKEERELLKRIKYFINIYEKKMGVEVSDIKLRKMTSYGVCHVLDKSIVFSKALYYLPDEFLEAVVVHEMAHIFVPNHSKRFYNKINKYLPKYREIWRKYKKIILIERA